MKNQKKQLIAMVISLVFLLAAYLGIDIYNEKQAEKEETEKIYLTDFDSQDISAFSYSYNGTQYSYTKTEDEWAYDGDTSIDMDESAIETLLVDVEMLQAADAITEYESLDTYGLDEPSQTISFTFTDETVFTIKIGDYNDMVGYYYMMIEGNDTLYMGDSTLLDIFEVSYEDLVYVEETTEITNEDNTEG